MLHLFGGATETRRLPGRFQVPWTQIVLIVVVLAAAVGLGFGVKYLLSSRNNTTPAVSAIQSVAPLVQPFDPAQGEQTPEIPAPVALAVVDYRGVPWGPVQNGFDPLTIPVEEGLCDGTRANMPWGATERPEQRAYALRVYPEFKDALAVLAAIACDAVDKNVVMLSVFADYLDKPPTERIAFSVNGGESWCNLLDLLPAGSRGGAVDVRIRASNDLFHLYGADNRPGYHWWEKVEKRSELPCS